MVRSSDCSALGAERRRLALGAWQLLPALGLLTALQSGCGVDEAPLGLKRTPAGDGPTVRFDLHHRPLPEIPMPNDVAMWPDPTSRTGLRINASQVAPTHIEQSAREKFNQLEGWGTFAGVSVAFDKRDPKDPRPAIDLAALKRRHVGDDFEFADDAVYLVNLTTGVPVVLDIGEGNFQYVVREKGRYFRNDTRSLESNLLFETADETIDPRTGLFDPSRTADGTPHGLPIYSPQWDTDFDGVLDRPNLIDPTACPSQAQVELGEVSDVARDRCMADQLLTWYERETDTLLMRPLIPMDEKTEYAVVITDRVRDLDGNAVRSPFDFVYHPSQEGGARKLLSHLNDPSLAAYYGDVAGTGLDRVSFAWTFTTQPVVEDLRLIRDGLYGTGPFAYLSKQFPAAVDLMRITGPVDSKQRADGMEEPARWYDDPSLPSCQGRLNEAYLLDFEANRGILSTLATQFGITGAAAQELTASWEAISHAVIGSFRAPFFISGGPRGTSPSASFNLDYETGEGEVHSDSVQFILTVPKAQPGHAQPFPVAYYGHGYTSSNIEHLGFAGSLAKQGIASVGVNSTFHGLGFDRNTETLARALLRGSCAAPLGDALLAGRGRDLNRDGDPLNDSGGDYWTSYIFHTRDVVRQSAVDLLQLFRIFKSFDGSGEAPDYDQDGTPNVPGDFDGDGTPDVGGQVSYHAWGQSLGGFLAPLLAALDPDVVSAAPVAGAAGLLDVGGRTFQGGVFEGVYLRNFGPLIVGVPPEEIPKDRDGAPITACEEGQISLRMVVVDVNDDRELELGCLDDQGLIRGGTVIVHNINNGEARCGRVAGDDAQGLGSGRFRVGVPTSVGDRLFVSIYDQPDAVATYHPDGGCKVTPGAKLIARYSSWGKGLVAQGAVDPTGNTERVVCNADGGCTGFQGQYFAKGDPLRAPVEGFGYVRQTPSLRRFMSLAGTAVDPGDPANYVPYAALKPLPDPWGDPQPPTALLNMVTIGDMNVPLNAGISMGRVAGAIPFMRPDAAQRYPSYADYVTPAALFSSLGDRTPNRVLLENHVIEGINRLERTPTSGACFPNRVSPADDTFGCLASCAEPADCPSGVCVEGRCQAPPTDPARCQQYLFDVDAIDEGLAPYGEREASVPLRLGRIASAATPQTIDAVWAPRLLGTPHGSDANAWTADAPLIAMLMGYVNPRGEHGFSPADPCEAWVTGRYYINLVGRFFATDGQDLHYLTHPATHQCLGRAGGAACEFLR
ncbi:MAG: hypothetical protein KIT72_10830 [Polyangiaceae bacterium]|nr:hypothetical protein [Polyangiaceae bacterium]MCW5790906.1 hypothetical protein [Polyangiaceae bacterium]